MSIRNSVAFVTGANRGLGLAFVHALLAAGARKIYATARNPESIDLPGVQAIRLDVTSDEQAAAAALACGDVNLLINNAGISLEKAFLSPGGMDAAHAEMETNYFGPLRMARAFAPVLAKNGGGGIINVNSVLSWLNIPQFATSSASKAAAWSLTTGLRNELLAQGTSVLGVHVGFMETDMAKGATGPKANPADVARDALAALEAGRHELLADDLTRQVKSRLSAEAA